VILHPRRGVLLIETRDWRLDTILKIYDRNTRQILKLATMDD
jgi:hypothetical protein